MNILKRIIKSTGFQTAIFMAVMVAFLYWGIGLCSNDGAFGGGAAKTAAKTETSIIDMEVYTETTITPTSFKTAEPTVYPRETEHDFHFSDVKIRIIPANKATTRRLALFQQNTLVADIEIPENAKDFRILNYDIGATGALYVNIEVDNKLVQMVSNDMYWEPTDTRTDPWRIQPRANYVENAIAATVTTKTFDNNLYFAEINTVWRLVDGALYANDRMVLVRVMNVEHFPLVQTKSGWSIIRFDRDDGWQPEPFKLYESDQNELFQLIRAVAETKTAEVQHSISHRLKELGLTLDDIDTAQKTIFVKHS